MCRFVARKAAVRSGNQRSGTMVGEGHAMWKGLAVKGWELWILEHGVC